MLAEFILFKNVMSKFIIQGGAKLNGEIKASGFKNAALPIIAATLLTKEVCVLTNIPQIADVDVLLEILRSLGAKVKRKNDRVEINNKDVSLKNINKKLIKKMRASILLIGPMLARFKKMQISEPGGCIIGNRPIDTHLYAFEKMGAKIKRSKDILTLSGENLKATTIILPEFSVTATENAIMTAVLIPGTTIIKIAATEPHVEDLVKFLNKMGAKIVSAGNHIWKIQGVKNLKGAKHKIIPDQIEIGTFAIIGVLTGGEIIIKNIIPEHLEIILVKFSEIGIKYKLGKDYLKIFKSEKLKAFKIDTKPYPGFCSDLQSPMGVLATQCSGTSLIHDTMYEGRMSYVNELIKMGVNATLCDPHRVLITGKTKLRGREIKSLDLRAGATLIIAALIAKGKSVIHDAEIIDRGYEKIDEKLKKLGANIAREK